MLLQLLISHYKEEHELVKRLLDSIELQQDVNRSDFGVIICNDGDECVLDRDWLNSYSFKIDYYVEEWSDTSGCRQHCFDHAEADYVMYCDSDDLFFRATALLDIFNLIVQKRPDVITSQFLSDYYENGQLIGIRPHNNDNVWIHGKIFRRQYLIDRNINWCIKLGHNFEDSYYIRQALSCTQNIAHIDNPFWFWKYRPVSLVRLAEGKYQEQDNYSYRIISNDALIEAFLAKGMINEAANYAFVQVYEGYFMMINSDWSGEHAKYKIESERLLREFIKAKSWLIEKVPNENAMIMIDVLRNRFYREKGKISIESITFNDWKTQLMSYQDLMEGNIR